MYKNDFNELGFVARGGGVFLFLKFKESNSPGWGHHAINQFVHTSPLVLVSLLWIVYNHFLDGFDLHSSTSKATIKVEVPCNVKAHSLQLI